MQDRIAEVQQTIVASSAPSSVFGDLSWKRRREVFFTLPETAKERLVADMGRKQLRTFVRRLDPDEATDVLGYADEDLREAVIADLDADRRDKIEFLLSFDPESAAGLMDLDYVTVGADRHLSQAAERVQRFEERTDRVPTILVTDDERLLGELPGAALSLADSGAESVTDHVREIPQVRYDRDDSEVLDVFRENRQRTVAVLNEEDDVLGVIHADDLLTVIEENAGETLYEFTGVAEEESALDGPGAKVRNRYKWLIVNLGTAFLAAAVVGLFESTIASIAVLAAYMPVVAGMGGNAGTQAMAVTVRGISLGQVSLSTGRRVITNEVIAGAVNGIITGALVAVIAIAFSLAEFGVLLGAVIGVSMVANLVIAGFFGAIVPLVLDRFGQDPATSATIFITTATDVLGFFVFLGLARSVLL
ncbi:CBS domain-containing protein [Halobaculum sp. WSA2]|uniref:CBS domain-containing protein n=1 Tax=Halobaculum saliterrae TaxID=2073113 RepID=A0A6B0SNB0_9EURY|nr:magnesium transporter [Halobaculum saliterrae]MXR39857.1 CBS domain-containing protein [Halobaculum saliterrae]